MLPSQLFYGSDRLLNLLIASGEDRKAISLSSGGKTLYGPFLCVLCK